MPCVTKIVEAEGVREAGGGARARRRFRPKEVCRNGAPFSAAKTRPTGPFSADQAKCCFTFLWREALDLVSPGARLPLVRSGSATRTRITRLSRSADAGRLFGAHRAVGAEVDHEAPADADRIGERVDLSDGCDTAFGRGLLARALDSAGVAADQIVVDRRLRDAFEEAIRLGDGRLGVVVCRRSPRHSWTRGAAISSRSRSPKAGRMQSRRRSL